MAYANSVRQALLCSDFCPLPKITSVCWSFPVLESESARGSMVQQVWTRANNGNRNLTKLAYKHCKHEMHQSVNCGLALKNWPCICVLQLYSVAICLQSGPYECIAPQSFDCLLEPCACILRKLVYVDPSLRHSLAQHNLLLLTLLRGTHSNTPHLVPAIHSVLSGSWTKSQFGHLCACFKHVVLQSLTFKMKRAHIYRWCNLLMYCLNLSLNCANNFFYLFLPKLLKSTAAQTFNL